MFLRRRKFRRKELSALQRWEIIRRDKLSCVQCKSEIHLRDTKTPSTTNGAFHHIVPLIYGGANDISNACLLCRPCHNQIHSGSEDASKYLAMFENFIRGGKLV